MTAARGTLAVVCITTAMLMLDIAVVNTALFAIADDLDTGLTGIQWVVDAYTLALASAVLGAGSFADRLGRRRVFLGGLVLFTAASAACAAAPDIVVLDTARAVQGVGAAVLFAVSLALLAHAFPDPGGRARALAAYGATIGASFALGPLAGGMLTEWAHWRWIFLVNVPVGLACLAGTRRWVAESRDPRPRSADWPGQLLLAAAMSALVFGLLRAPGHGWSNGVTAAAFVVAGVCGAAFLVRERRAREPMLPLGMLANRAFAAAQAATFAISASLFAVFLYTTLYLQTVVGLSPLRAGLVYLPGTIAMFVVAGATSSLGPRLRPRFAVAGSLVLISLGLVLTVRADADDSWTSLVPGTVIAFVGAGVFNPVMSGIVLGETRAEHFGLAAGINDAFRQTGIAVGVAALGAFLPAAGPFGTDPAAYVEGLHHALLAAAVIAAAGAAAALLLPNRPTAASPLPAPPERQRTGV
ncbi:MFS transporter [Yinghuangia aomiensis]|uniref:MFS transporter n=1 Tax=Yinghuangia aomiensis TaxID=676205 RepID=A0ABP9H4Q7_9ACTN